MEKCVLSQAGKRVSVGGGGQEKGTKDLQARGRMGMKEGGEGVISVLPRQEGGHRG